MFCNRCGGELPPNKALCPHCGKQVPPEAIRMSMPVQPVWTPQPVVFDRHAQLRAQHPELQGVGGWLGTYAWLNLAFTPLFYASQLVKPDSAFRLALHNPLFQLTLALGVYGMVVGFLIVTKSPFAVRNAKLRLIIQALVSACTFVLAMKHGGLPTGLLGVASAALWYAYFARSTRVKLTLDPPLPNSN